jgi:biopolymer transport protein ExbD
LVIFLLVNFSATGEVFFINKDVKLPLASHATPIGNAPLISISRDTVTFDAEKVGDNPLHIEESDQNLPQLRLALKKVMEFEKIIRPNEPFKGSVNIQADENTPIIYVKRVMNTLISEGWTGIHFATRKPEKTAAN